jgi:hypothetical protein
LSCVPTAAWHCDNIPSGGNWAQYDVRAPPAQVSSDLDIKKAHKTSVFLWFVRKFVPIQSFQDVQSVFRL